MADNGELPQEFWDSFEQVYGLKDDQQEKASAKTLISALQKEIQHSYRLERVLDKGGAGLVLKLCDVRMSNCLKAAGASDCVYRALKVPRPIPERAQLLSSLLGKEVAFLTLLTHTNVIKVYSSGSVEVQSVSYPYYVMDYIEEATTPTKYLADPSRTYHDMLSVLQDVLEGFCYLTSQHVAHNDPKPDNILIDSSGRAIISDLGSAKRTDAKGDNTLVAFTFDYAPREKKEKATAAASDHNRVRLEIPPSSIPIEWDIYSVGRSFKEMLEIFSRNHPELLGNYESHYLRLMIARMLGKEVAHDETILGLPTSFFSQLAYHSFEDVRADLAKLDGTFNLSEKVPEFNMQSMQVIQCPMSGTLPRTSRLLTLLGHPAIKRLNSVSQLGLLHYIYPNATHTRFEHSLGSYGNAVRMIHALWADPINPLFRQIMRPKDLIAVSLAVLLHDLGQYALAHDLEEADKDCFSHERFTLEMLGRKIDGEVSIGDMVDTLWGAGTADRIKRILECDPKKPSLPIRERILHTLVDGPLDADKLDYLYRDSTRLRVPYGLVLDYERIIGFLTIIHETKGQELFVRLGIHERGRIGAECVAFARYALYAAAYWHYRARAIKAMIHRAVWEISELQGANKAQGRKRVQASLRPVILDNNALESQGELFSQSEESHRYPHWPGMQTSDLRTLAWIRSSTSETGQLLVDSLIRRDLFEPVVSVTNEVNRRLYTRLQSIRREGPDRILQLQNLLAAKISTTLNSLPTEERKESRFLTDAYSRSFDDHVRANDPIVLVDVPVSPTTGLGELQYLPDAEGWRTDGERIKPRDLADSPVWKSILESFEEGVGKIHVFVMPEFTETVRSLRRQRLVELLEAAAEEIG